MVGHFTLFGKRLARQGASRLLKPRLGLWLFLACLGIFLSLHHSELGRYVDVNLAHKTQMLIRERLGFGPTIHPKLKIYALDDFAVTKLKNTDIDLQGWVQLIGAFSAAKPRAIIIDKKFGVLTEDDDIETFYEVLGNASPVFVGAYTKHRNQLSRFPLDSLVNLSRPEFDLNLMSQGRLESLDWLPVLNHEAYGPQYELEKAFSRIGHLNYDDIGLVDPIRRVAIDKALPHLTLMTGESLALDEGGVLVNGERVPLDNRKLLPVNFPSRNELFQNTKSLYSIIVRAQRGIPLTKVQKDDVVLVLPMFFTGNADMGQTPLGRVPLGFVVASLVNSVLNNDWLKPLPIDNEAIALACVFGALAGNYLSPLLFWVCISSLTLLFTGLGLGLFCYFGFMLPWLSAVVALGGAGIVFFSLKMARQARVAKAYEIALSGLVSRTSLRELVRNPQAISREASEQLLTIMFIDMVSFSSMAEKENPQLVFRRLKTTLGSFAETVHSFGGVVDKTLGDGMLCFFGYNYIGGKTSENHADQAITCALAIQRSHARRNLEELASGEPMIPLRIGINSAKVFIGDLGSKDRIDFTLIGNGVNFAQRLEAACDPFSILLSEHSLRLANSYSLKTPGVKRKKIKVKHHVELFEVLEIDPFHDDRAVLERARKAFHERKGMIGRDPRWPVINPEAIAINTMHGDAVMLNFSRTGFAMAIPKKLEAGESLDITIRALSGRQRSGVKFPVIVGEVRWVSVEDGAFVHGIRIINLDEDEKERVYQYLQNLMTRII